MRQSRLVLFALAIVAIGCARSSTDVDTAESTAPATGYEIGPDEEIGTLDATIADDPHRAFDILMPVNYAIYWINDPLNRFVVKPVAVGYAYIIPRPVRHGVNNFLNNLMGPLNSLNNLLQAKPGNAGSELGRFAINTTAGGLGFYDFAEKKMGIEPRPEDLGQTLGKWRIPEGPYLVLPLLGPTTLRDLPSHLTMSRDAQEWHRGQKKGPIRYIAAWSILSLNGKSLTYGSYDESRQKARDAGISHYRYIRDNLVDIRYRKARDLPPRTDAVQQAGAGN